jgi:hypothetical protein
VVINGVRVALAELTILDAATMEVGSQVVVNQPVTIEASSLMEIDGARIQTGSFAMVDTSEVVIYGRKKWENESDTSETWTPQEDTSESWTVSADTSVDWSDESDTPETWTASSSNSKTWQVAA